MDTDADLMVSLRSGEAGTTPTDADRLRGLEAGNIVTDQSSRWLTAGRRWGRDAQAVDEAIREALTPTDTPRYIVSDQSAGRITAEMLTTARDRMETVDNPSTSMVDAFRHNIEREQSRLQPWQAETLRRGTERVEFPVNSYHFAQTVPRLEMDRLAGPEDRYLLRLSQEFAGKMNNAMIQHLVEACSTDELMNYKRSIIAEIKKRNNGESHDPTIA